MISFKNTGVFNFDHAIMGMRNPLESWDQSDSCFRIENTINSLSDLIEINDAWMRYDGYEEPIDDSSNAAFATWLRHRDEVRNWLWKNSALDPRVTLHNGTYANRFYFGPKDLKLAQKLILAGEDESKFMRQIFVTTDITMPLYFAKEFDTYKISTTANSTSTMHKLTSRPIKINDFSFDEESNNLTIATNDITHGGEYDFDVRDAIDDIIYACEKLRQKYVETQDKRYWRALIQLLPESYNQTRTWTANYAVLRNIYFARRNHKLSEWHDFCRWIESLPYAHELICLEKEKKGR